MLKDNFSFLDNSSSCSFLIENDFWSRLESFFFPKQEKGTKDGNITYTTQGKTGNCWILSAINALAYCKSGREIISKSLEYKNGYTVIQTICGDYVVLDSEIRQAKANNLYSKGDDDMIIFELALEKIINDYAKNRIKILKNANYLVKRTLKKTPTKNNKSSTILGYPGACFYFLTGIEPKATTSQPKMMLFLRKFKNDNNKNIVLCCSSFSKITGKIKDINNKNVPFYPCHGYSIKNFDGENVTIVNPHDSSKEIVLSRSMFFKMFSNIQMCDLSSCDKKELFKPKMFYNKFGKLEKTIEIDENGYNIQYDYTYNKKGIPTNAKCCAQHTNGIYVICIRDFLKKQNYIENGNVFSGLALIRFYQNEKLIKMFFGKNRDTNDNLEEISIDIGKQIQEYALYQYSNLDRSRILTIANDLKNGNFESAFEYCR